MLLSIVYWLTQFLHPGQMGHHGGYWFWSGIEGSITQLSIIGLIIGLYRKHECHVDGCFWPAWHVDEESGHPVCRGHHPHGRGHESLRKRKRWQ